MLQFDVCATSGLNSLEFAMGTTIAVLPSPMPQSIASARMILMIVAGSYVLSAAILGFVRWRGTTVPSWMIGGWLVTGLLGIALSAMLAPGRGAVWVLLMLVLFPWMIYSLVSDLRSGNWIIACTDVAALLAIAYAAFISYSDVFRSSSVL